MMCKEKVWHGRAAFACSRVAVRDGYCKQHHPDADAARRAARDARSAAKNKAKEAIEAAEREVIEQAKAWYRWSFENAKERDTLEIAVRRLIALEEGK